MQCAVFDVWYLVSVWFLVAVWYLASGWTDIRCYHRTTETTSGTRTATIYTDSQPAGSQDQHIKARKALERSLIRSLPPTKGRAPGSRTNLLVDRMYRHLTPSSKTDTTYTACYFLLPLLSPKQSTPIATHLPKQEYATVLYSQSHVCSSTSGIGVRSRFHTGFEAHSGSAIRTLFPPPVLTRASSRSSPTRLASRPRPRDVDCAFVRGAGAGDMAAGVWGLAKRVRSIVRRITGWGPS
jgi:hypothetical protein